MRVLPLISLCFCIACAACGPQSGGNAVAPVSGQTKASSAAKEAQALAARYLTLLGNKDYEAARAMWGHGGADVGGSTADFARTFEPYSKYEGQAGEPTDIKTTDGQDYVAVAATAKVTLKKSGETKDRAGLIRFRRPVSSAGKSEPWTIWAVDMRKPH